MIEERIMHQGERKHIYDLVKVLKASPIARKQWEEGDPVNVKHTVMWRQQGEVMYTSRPAYMRFLHRVQRWPYTYMVLSSQELQDKEPEFRRIPRVKAYCDCIIAERQVYTWDDMEVF